MQTVTREDVLNNVNEWLEDIDFRPFAMQGWFFTIEEDPDTEHLLVLILVNHFARDSRTFDFGADEDEWTMMDGMTQTSTRKYAPHELSTKKKFEQQCAVIVANFFAHEALEWLRSGERMIHDPHEDGDVAVIL